MVKSKNILISLAALGLVAIVGAVAGLGLSGAFDSGESSRAFMQEPEATPTPTTAPAPNGATIPTPAPAQAEAPGSDSVSEIPTSTPAPAPAPDGASVPDSATETPAPTPTPTPEPAIEPDAHFEKALRRAFISPAGWKTDFSLHSVPYDEILSGGPPRDGIPPLDDPKFTTTTDADRWLRGEEPVIVFELNGDARAYPIQIITWHEIVNDIVGGAPVAVTFCPLCNSAIVFDRILEGVVYDFGTSGNLRNSDLIMWDRQTESWWQQFTGEGIVGELTGKKLTFLSSSIISWEDFKAAHPEGKVLSRDTGHSRPYGSNPYAGYDRADLPPFLYDGIPDGRLLPKELVAAVTIGDVDAAFPFSILEEERVVNYNVNGRDLAIFFAPGASSAFRDRLTGEYNAVGATGVFDANLDGQMLSFRADGDNIVDDETGSVWNILGQAIEGPLSGSDLTPIIHGNHFWFAWGAFKPDTKIYQGAT